MSLRSRLFGSAPVIEEKLSTSIQSPENIPPRAGYEFGIPAGGTQAPQVSLAVTNRQQMLEMLYDTYVQCSWVSVCVDVIARTVTAGGLDVVPDDDIPEGETPPEPPLVTELRRLLHFANEREDMVQILRSTITDLLVFGDAFLEVTRLLGVPVALYTLDATTMTVLADEHGAVSGYVQQVDPTRSVQFKPEDVIHISLDSPRGGLYGMSPTQRGLLPITAYLFTQACIKEAMRRGDPGRPHVDLPAGTREKDRDIWWQRYQTHNLGPRNIGTPILTIGGGVVKDLGTNQIRDWLEALRQLRDEILSVYGVPPSKAGVIESGNLGGGTGEAQDKTFRINTSIPIANLLLEKMNYALVQQGFGITGWHLEFEEIDYRDSATVETIREKRFLRGAYTINRWRSEIGEPPIDGGDDAVLVERGNMVLWKDMAAYTQAEMAKLEAEAQPPEPSPAGVPAALVSAGAVPGGSKDAPLGAPPKESRGPDEEMRALEASFRTAFQHRRRKTLKDLPQ